MCKQIFCCLLSVVALLSCLLMGAVAPPPTTCWWSCCTTPSVFSWAALLPPTGRGSCCSTSSSSLCLFFLVVVYSVSVGISSFLALSLFNISIFNSSFTSPHRHGMFAQSVQTPSFNNSSIYFGGSSSISTSSPSFPPPFEM